MNIKNGFIAGALSLGIMTTGCAVQGESNVNIEVPKDEPKIEQIAEDNSIKVSNIIDSTTEFHNIEDDLTQEGKKKLDLYLQKIDCIYGGEIDYFGFSEYYSKEDFDKGFDKYQKYIEMLGNGVQLTMEQEAEMNKLKDMIDFYSNPDNKKIIKNLIDNNKQREEQLLKIEREIAKIKVSKEDQEIIDRLVSGYEMNYQRSNFY